MLLEENNMPSNNEKHIKKIFAERDLPHTTQKIQMPKVKPPKEKKGKSN